MSQPAVQAALCPGVPAARRGPADGRPAGGRSERSPAKWPGLHTVDFGRGGASTGKRGLKGTTTGESVEQTYKHRARDAFGSGGLAACRAEARKSEGGHRTSTSLDVARRRGPWVHQDLWRPARPRILSGAAQEIQMRVNPRIVRRRRTRRQQRIRAAERWLRLFDN